MQHTARNRDVGNIRNPELIGPRLIEAAIQQVGVFMDGLLAAGIRPAPANDGQ